MPVQCRVLIQNGPTGVAEFRDLPRAGERISVKVFSPNPEVFEVKGVLHHQLGTAAPAVDLYVVKI